MPLLTAFGITLPTFSDIASSAGPYATGFFNEMAPVAWLIIGFIVGAVLLAALLHWIPKAFHTMMFNRTSRRLAEPWKHTEYVDE